MFFLQIYDNDVFVQKKCGGMPADFSFSLKFCLFLYEPFGFSPHRTQKKADQKIDLFRVPSGILPLRSSDFVDYEPLWVLTPLNTKKANQKIDLFRVPSGIRTHDIQNHNLTL